MMDLTLSQTIHNFTNIHFIIPHRRYTYPTVTFKSDFPIVGGAFPSAIDRILKTYPAIYESSLTIYRTRCWWDSAGPTFFHQVSGLLGYGIPSSQIIFGTDYPHAPLPGQGPSLNAVKNSPLFTATEKTGILRTNAISLFGSKITCTLIPLFLSRVG